MGVYEVHRSINIYSMIHSLYSHSYLVSYILRVQYLKMSYAVSCSYDIYFSYSSGWHIVTHRSLLML